MTKNPKRTKDDKGKEEEKLPTSKGGQLADIYELLEVLLPQKKDLLTATLRRREELLQEKQRKEKNKDKYLLEVEKEKNKCLRELLEIFLEQYRRVSADYANYQKRTPKQIADSVAYEKKAIIGSLLPSLDNFAHALAIADNAEAVDGVVKGVRMVFEHMLDALKGHGLEQISALGQEFDPTVHEAIQLRAEADKPDNIVLEDFQMGYKLNGQVVRPSKVSVNRLPAEDKEAEPEVSEAAQAQEDGDQTADSDASDNGE